MDTEKDYADGYEEGYSNGYKSFEISIREIKARLEILEIKFKNLLVHISSQSGSRGMVRTGDTPSPDSSLNPQAHIQAREGQDS